MKEVPGSEFNLEADLVLLALGFSGSERRVFPQELVLDSRGNVSTDENLATSLEGVFAAGDMRRGQSLVVWAIREGRRAARAIDTFLMGDSFLPG
jgi:glutamate synthase (NADPH/NADH) small chain